MAAVGAGNGFLGKSGYTDGWENRGIQQSTNNNFKEWQKIKKHFKSQFFSSFGKRVQIDNQKLATWKW